MADAAVRFSFVVQAGKGSPGEPSPWPTMDQDFYYRSGVQTAYRDHVVRILGYRIPVAHSAADLIAMAKKAAAGELEAKYGWRTEPPFPGVTEEPDKMPTGWRMICACRFYEGDTERGVIFTTFVGGRPVAVFVHGPGMELPKEYKPLALR